MSRATAAGLQRMRSAEYAMRYPHGDRNRYSAGCRCGECRAGAAAYARELRRRAEKNPMVSAARARHHLRALQAAGVGRDAVAAACDVGYSTIIAVREGRQLHIRAATERRLLAVTTAAAADAALVDAGEAWRLIDDLVEEGYQKQQIARMLGYAGKGIPLQRTRITVRNAARVRDLHHRLTAEAALPLPTSKPRTNNAAWRREQGRAEVRA